MINVYQTLQLLKIKKVMNEIMLEQTVIKRGCGRPAKVVKTLEEQEDEVILKYLQGEPLTLEETALSIWMQEGRKGKPMTKPGIMAIEARALAKLKQKLAERGINDISELIGDNHSVNGKWSNDCSVDIDE